MILRQMIDETQQQLQLAQQETQQNNQAIYQLQQRNQQLDRQYNTLEGRLNALQEVASKCATFPDGEPTATDNASDTEAAADGMQDEATEKEKESVN